MINPNNKNQNEIENLKQDENLLEIIENSSLNKINEQQKKKKNIHKHSIKCLNKCTLYLLTVTIKHEKTNVGYQFNNNKNAYFCPNISSFQVLSFLKQKEEIEGLNINSKLNLQKLLTTSEDNKFIEQNLSFPIENLNPIKNEISIWDDPSVSLLSNNHGNTSCILIEFDLNSCKEQNKYFREINKSFTEREIKCNLNGIVHEKELLKNDISFSIDTKQLVKSIGYRIEDYKKEYLNLTNKKLFKYKNTFMTQIIKRPNIGIIISTNNKKDLINIEKLQTNFNSILNKKFILLKLFVAINIPNYLSNKIKISDDIMSNSNFSQSSKGIPALSINSEGDSINNFNFLNTELSINNSPHSSFLNNSEINDNNINLNNSFSHKQIKGKYSEFNFHNLVKFSCFIPKKQKGNIFNNYNKKEKNNQEIKIKRIIINKFDIFSNEIFKKYKTKSNYLSNFLIFKKNIKILISNKKNFRLIYINEFFKIFERISSFGLILPIINEKGNYQTINYSPSLSSLILYINNNELYESFLSNHLSSISTQSNGEDNIILNNIFQRNDFYTENTKSYLLGQSILFEFNETKPPFLRLSLNEQINKILYPIINSNIKIKIGEIDLEKSYFVISWNPINSYENQTSFLTYYNFNGSLIGILPIKLEINKWLASICLNENESYYKSGNELKKNISKIENFLFNYNFYNEQQNIPNIFSSDYEFYLKNKLFFHK